ncbi:MAG: hypothetical protein GEV28_01685 [Actinophytocola sp.]|uniref:hypothetical protein n=1 Tax=Actinophytocola sp. TaxID=1872138 RepID=UPI001328C83E|nr:hypothetical protein [Actinophytocola sp.]MPZ79164.1 hypothetical protein [Actinophytocola sp.]
MNELGVWPTLLVAFVPVIAATGAAVIAGLYARSAKLSDLEAQRARDLTDRIAERKYETYKPMINALRDMLAVGKEGMDKLGDIPALTADFVTWISIFGSDGAVTAFHNFMQASYSNAPVPILIRLYGEFLVAARKDMGDSETKVFSEQLLGMRITDIYNYSDVIDPSFDEVCDRLAWQAPWLSPNVVPRTI